MITTRRSSPVHNERLGRSLAGKAGIVTGAGTGIGEGIAINPGSYNGTTVDPEFTYTSDRPYTDNCGYTQNLTYYLLVRVPLTETGYDLSAMQIVPNSSSEITVTCTTNT